jgi:tetratricopeptide (TPR) repeat protein
MAQERQEAGDLDAAIQHYERAIGMGTERSDVFYSLGLLYQDRGNHQRAVELLPRAAADEEYALSAHYMLGQSYQALGQLAQAASEYEQTIRLLPLDTIGKSESEDMIQMYESAAQIYTQLNDIARAASLYSTLASFLQSKRWGRERADEFRQKAKELTERNMFAKLRTLGTGALIAPDPGLSAVVETTEETMPETWGKIRPITDFLRSSGAPAPADAHFAPSAAPRAPAAATMIEELPPAPRPSFAALTPLNTAGLDEVAARYVVASEKYAEQGLMLAAIDACLEVIRIEVDYLPIHLRMGEIYEREERREEALQKYQLLIDTYAARGQQQQSIDVYYRLIALSPDTINTRSRLAELLKNSNRMDEAAEQVALVAGSYFRLGQTNKALEEYRRGLQWAPSHPELHAQYGQALFKLERFEAALGEFRRALELDQNSPVAIARINMTLAMMSDQLEATWQSLATVLERLKAQPQANADVQAEYRAALLSADEPILHYILGIVQQAAEQHQSALLEFEQAAALIDGDADLRLIDVLVSQAAADSYIALGQADDARKQLQHCLEIARPQTPGSGVRYPFSTPLSHGELVRRMAEAYAASGDLQNAERALQLAKQHLPYDRAIYTKLADIYFQQGKLTEALTQLEELATHYESRQDLDRAIDALETGVKLAPNNIPIGSRLAKLYVRRGYLDKGIEHMTRVAEQQRKAGQLKDAVLSLQQVAEIHSTLGNQDAALAIFDKIVQIMPNDIETRQWLAIMHTLAFRTKQAIAEKKQLVRIYLQQRDLEGATEELFTIIALDQADKEAHLQLGDVLMRREEYEQALRIYTRLAKMPNIETERVEALQAAAKRMFDQQQLQRKPQPTS